jgi:hypothetical protein
MKSSKPKTLEAALGEIDRLKGLLRDLCDESEHYNDGCGCCASQSLYDSREWKAANEAAGEVS